MGVGMVMYLWLWIWYGYGLYLAISYGYGTTRTRARKAPGKTTKSRCFITLEKWHPNSTKNAKCALSKVRFEPTGVDKTHFAHKNRAILPALSRGVCDFRRGKNAAIPAIPPMPDNHQQEGNNTMKTKKLQDAVKGMQVKNWEIREFSNSKRKLYAQFVPKKPQVEVVVKEN